MAITTPILNTWTPDLVQASPDQVAAFCEYCQQTLGVPWPTLHDMMILRKKIKELFGRYPNADYRTLCRIVVWMRARKWRVARVWAVVDKYRDAWAAGQLPELDPGYQPPDLNISSLIADALEEETDPVWRDRLLLASNPAAQREVYGLWQTSSASP